MNTFHVDDVVTWTSQSSGVTKTKTGIVIAVLSAGVDPMSVIPPRYFDHHRWQTYGMPRDHESYLVLVEETIYWPRVKYLRKKEATLP